MFLNVTEIFIFSFPMMRTRDGWKEGGIKKEAKLKTGQGQNLVGAGKRKLFCKNKNQEEEAHPALMEFFSDPVCC